MNEIISLNGENFRIWYSTPNERQKAIIKAQGQCSSSSKSIKSLQANLVQNPGFETVSPTAQYQPANWWSDYDPAGGALASFPYNSPSDLPGRTGKGAAIVASASGRNYWGQRISGVSPSTSYTLTGYVKTTSVAGTGAFLELDWFDSSNQYISGSASTSTPKTGTSDWSQMTVSSTAPSNAASVNVILFLYGSGTVVFDDITLTSGGGGGCTPGVTPCSPTCLTGVCPSGYYCSSTGTCVPSGGGCTPGVTPCSPTCLTGVCPSGYYCSSTGTCVPTGGGGGGGATCDPVTCPSDTNYCVFGTCVPKNYVKYGGIGFLALFMLSMFKK
ncbi:MAG: hypothetical protein PHP08_00315 [Candidatus Dojkabacteria bacterium]|nr:hypothetical protein [Candidatus Dojkabacteria bacterium]